MRQERAELERLNRVFKTTFGNTSDLPDFDSDAANTIWVRDRCLDIRFSAYLGSSARRAFDALAEKSNQVISQRA